MLWIIVFLVRFSSYGKHPLPIAAGKGCFLFGKVGGGGTQIAPILQKSGFYNLFWGAKVTVQIRVLSASTFFNKKIGICTQILYN